VHEELEAAFRVGQPIGEVGAHHSEHRRLVVATARAPVTVARDDQLALRQRQLLSSTVGSSGGGCVRMDAEHRDGTAKPFLHHVQQEQSARDAAGGGRLLTIISALVREEEEVEADVEADAELLPSADLGGARPVVRASEVVQQRGCGAHEAARLAGAVAGRVRAHLTVAFLAVVGRCRVAAVSRVRAGDADAVHQALHGVAPAVAAARGGAADMAQAVPGGLQLVSAGRAHHMPHLALRFPANLFQEMLHTNRT